MKKEKQNIIEDGGNNAAAQVEINILKQQLHMAQLRIIELDGAVNRLIK